jgi:hypothetical protein
MNTVPQPPDSDRRPDGAGERGFGAAPEDPRATGAYLVINADDFGRDRLTTDRTLECLRYGSVSSVSAMVFMEDSERAAEISRDRMIDAGLHLNFTSPLSASRVSPALVDHLQRLTRHLRRHRFAPVVFHPGLIRSFDYVVNAQLEEFRRLYGVYPGRIDGHHHMHLCANVLFGNLLPAGTRVRRNFSFRPGEKGLGNRLYRGFVDRMLSRRHPIMDYLFTLPPLAPPERLSRIFSLARTYAVEVETHPVIQDEYQFLTGGDLFRWTEGTPIRPFSAMVPAAGINKKESCVV